MNSPRLTPTVLLCATLLLGACAATPEIIYVTATPDAGVPAAQSFPSDTPAPTAPRATATPEAPPNIAFQMGERYQVNGYNDLALTSYQSVAARSDAPADLRAEAAFRAGQMAVREGLFAEGVQALTVYLTTYPSHARVPQAHFLRADAYLGLSRWTEAINDLYTYLALRPGLIDSYAYERVGDAFLAIGQREDALSNYANATAASRTLVPQLALREKVAEVYLGAGQVDAAVAEFDAILDVARNNAYRANIASRAANALADAGRADEAQQRLLDVFQAYPTTSQAYEAMQRLEAAGISLDDYARGQVAYAYGDYPTAIQALNAYTTQMQLAAIPPELYLTLGRSYREIGNNAAAVVAFQTLVEQFPRSAPFGDALLEQGRTLFLAGDATGAIETYQRIARDYAGLTPIASEALWRVGYLYSTLDDADASRAAYEALAEAYPNTTQARDGLFSAAAAAFEVGDTTDAERLYARLATTTTTGEDQAAAYLWVGRLARARGDEASALSAFRLAAQAAPDSYFGARAQDIVNGVAPFQPPAQPAYVFDDSAAVVQAEAWLRQTFDITQEGALWQLPATLDEDVRLVRGRELFAVGAYRDAETEFMALVEAVRGDALASYQLAVYLRGLGAYYPSIFAAADVINAASIDTLQAPPYIARMRYPVYYLDVVQPASERHGADPLLLFALIRAESLFNANATAAAGEIGLTQVIPSTGAYIAEQLGWPSYQHTDLFRPYAAAEFGAFYLGEQLRLFNGNAAAALAGYNAGPGRAQQWLRMSGGDPDAFMTAITISSTRGYVQRIYGFYNVYRTLYSAT